MRRTSGGESVIIPDCLSHSHTHTHTSGGLLLQYEEYMGLQRGEAGDVREDMQREGESVKKKWVGVIRTL